MLPCGCLVKLARNQTQERMRDVGDSDLESDSEEELLLPAKCMGCDNIVLAGGLCCVCRDSSDIEDLGPILFENRSSDGSDSSRRSMEAPTEKKTRLVGSESEEAGFQMLVFDETLSLLTMVKPNGNHEVPSVGILDWQESAANFATSLDMRCVDIAKLVHRGDVGYEPDTTWIVLIVKTSPNQPLALGTPHIWNWVPIETAPTIDLQVPNSCKAWIESLRQTSTKHLTDLGNQMENMCCSPVAPTISENHTPDPSTVSTLAPMAADEKQAVPCFWCDQELGTMAYLPGAYLLGQQGPSGIAQLCDHCWSRSADACREMLKDSSPIHCETFQLLIFNDEMSVLTTTDTSETAGCEHTLPVITMRGWMAATSEFTASLGLQHSEIVQLMHPEDSGTTPDVPWIVVTLDAEKSQDRFSYQNLGSSNLPHWAWVPIGLFKEVLHIDGVNKVKTSMDKLSRTNSYVFGEPAPAEAMISDLVSTTRQSVLLDTTPTDFSDGDLVFYQDGRNTFMGKVTNQADDTLVLQDYAPNDNLYTWLPLWKKLRIYTWLPLWKKSPAGDLLVRRKEAPTGGLPQLTSINTQQVLTTVQLTSRDFLEESTQHALLSLGIDLVNPTRRLDADGPDPDGGLFGRSNGCYGSIENQKEDSQHLHCMSPHY